MVSSKSSSLGPSPCLFIDSAQLNGPVYEYWCLDILSTSFSPSFYHWVSDIPIHPMQSLDLISLSSPECPLFFKLLYESPFPCHLSHSSYFFFFSPNLIIIKWAPCLESQPLSYILLLDHSPTHPSSWPFPSQADCFSDSVGIKCTFLRMLPLWPIPSPELTCPLSPVSVPQHRRFVSRAWWVFRLPCTDFPKSYLCVSSKHCIPHTMMLAWHPPTSLVGVFTQESSNTTKQDFFPKSSLPAHHAMPKSNLPLVLSCYQVFPFISLRAICLT